MKLVERLMSLNARHILATGRLAGTQIELSGMDEQRGEDVVRPASGATFAEPERERVVREQRELGDSMAAIDRERDALEQELQAIDEALASLARPSEPDEAQR